MSEMLQKIVDGLNGPLFGRRLTLVSISEILKDSNKTVQLLIEVAEQVRPKPYSETDAYPRPQTQDEALMQVAEFAGCLLYDVEGGVTISPEAICAQLKQENSQQAVQMLVKILEDVPAAKQRCYQARYKAPIVIPAGIQITDEIQKLQQQLRAAQQQFQVAYDENRQVLSQGFTKKIDQMQTEKTQLVARQDKLVERIRQVKLQPAPDEAVALSKRRREALSDVETLKQQVQQQNDLRKAYLQRAQAVVNSAKGSAAGIIEACQAENRRVKQELINLPQEIAEKESLRELIIQDPTEEVLLQMEADLEASKKDLLRLRELNNLDQENGQSGEGQQQESQVIYLRQNLAKFKRKHAELQQRQEKALSDQTALDAKMKGLMATAVTLETVDAADEMPLIVFKDLIGKGKAMRPQMQRCAEERRYLQKETAILTRTTDILGSICQTYGQQLDTDGEAGMSTQNLHEARALLGEIESTLKQKRAFLQPKQAELGSQKRQLQQLEVELQQQRLKVKQLDASRQGAVYKLKMTLQRAEAESESLVSEIAKSEKKRQILQFELERVEKDKDFAQLKKEIMLEQNQIKQTQADLRSRQAQVKESLGSLLDQKKMFTQLVKLLQVKQESVKREAKEKEIQGDVSGGQVIKIGQF